MMDLSAIAKTAAALGMQLAGTVKIPVTLRLGTTPGTYDPATDRMTSTDASEIDVEALPYRRRGIAIEKSYGETLRQTKTIAIEAAKLPAGKEPNTNDTVLEGVIIWSIEHVEIDPGGALWILDLKRA